MQLQQTLGEAASQAAMHPVAIVGGGVAMIPLFPVAGWIAAPIGLLVYALTVCVLAARARATRYAPDLVADALRGLAPGQQPLALWAIEAAAEADRIAAAMGDGGRQLRTMLQAVTGDLLVLARKASAAERFLAREDAMARHATIQLDEHQRAVAALREQHRELGAQFEHVALSLQAINASLLQVDAHRAVPEAAVVAASELRDRVHALSSAYTEVATISL